MHRVLIMRHGQDWGLIDLDFSDMDESNTNLKVGDINWQVAWEGGRGR